MERKVTLIAYVFPELQTAKDVVRQMSKKSCFRRPFDKQHGKRSKTLLKSPREDLYHIDWWLWRKLSFKKSLLVICKSLGLSVNTLTASDKSSLFNRDILTELIQMQLSKKQKTFCQIFSAFFKSRSNFERFEKKNHRHSLCISEITDCERRG